MDSRKNTFNITINTGDYYDSQFMPRAFFTADELQEIMTDKHSGNFTIKHDNEEYQCCSTYSHTSPFVIFTLTNGANPHIPTRQHQVANRITDLEKVAAESTFNDQQNIVIAICLHNDFQLTAQQEERMQAVASKMGAQIYRLTDTREIGKQSNDLMMIESNIPHLTEIRGKILTKMVETTDTKKRVEEVRRAKQAEEQRKEEEAKRLAEEARIQKEKDDKKAAEEAAIKRKEDRETYEREKLDEWQQKFEALAHKIHGSGPSSITFLNTTLSKLDLRFKVFGLDLDELKVSYPEFLLYLLENDGQGDEFSNLMQPKKGRIRSKYGAIDNLNRIIKRQGAERLSDFCQCLKLTLDQVHELKAKDIDELAMRYYRDYPHLITLIGNHCKLLGEIHTNIINLDYDNEKKIIIPNRKHAEFIEKLLSSRLVNGRDMMAALSDIKKLVQNESAHFDNMHAMPSAFEAMLYIIGSNISTDNKYNELMKIADFCKAQTEIELKISELKKYGNQLVSEGRVRAGENCIKLANELDGHIKQYLNGGTDSQQASTAINESLEKGVATMRSDHRFLEIIAHILICATVIGLVILGIRAAFSNTHQFFINPTKREGMLQEVAQSWNKLRG